MGEDYDNPVIARDGTERLLRWNSRPLVDNDGNTWGVVGLGTLLLGLAWWQERNQQSSEATHSDRAAKTEAVTAMSIAMSDLPPPGGEDR